LNEKILHAVYAAHGTAERGALLIRR